MGKIFVSLFTLIQEVCFQSLVSCGLAGLPRYQFSAELNEMRCLDERESFVVYKSFSCCLLLSVLDTVLETKVLANKCKKIFPASICSKDLLGIIMIKSLLPLKNQMAALQMADDFKLQESILEGANKVPQRMSFKLPTWHSHQKKSLRPDSCTVFNSYMNSRRWVPPFPTRHVPGCLDPL